jgi:hypothetical protein
MELESANILGIRKENIGRVPKELGYGQAETMGDAKEVARWSRYTLL